MNAVLGELNKVWMEKRKDFQNDRFPSVSLDELTSSIVDTNPFYYYVIDYYDRSLSSVSAVVEDIYGLDPLKLTFSEVLNTIHPDDLDFVMKAQALFNRFICGPIALEKLLCYKFNYCFRSKMKGGEYALINHEELLLSVDKGRRYGKSLHIHTKADEYNNLSPGKVSFIGLNGAYSYLNMSMDEAFLPLPHYFERETQILKLASQGLNMDQIAEEMFVNVKTINALQQRIMKKTDFKTFNQLINECIRQGLI